MASALLFAGLLLAQGATTQLTVEAATGNAETGDVGYSELAGGDPQAAIARIKANRQLDAADPAAHINLGTAYARLGQTEAARAHYRAALISAERCDLQLADGSWVDSRKAARMADRMLERGEALALR